MLALGDALALVTSHMRGFRREDFARFHPAGSLGRQLSKVDEFMRPPADCRVAPQSRSVREVFVAQSRSGRRSGAIMLVNSSGRLVGLFTDSDLARLFEHNRDAALDCPIREVMTPHPASVGQGSMMLDAIAMMAERKISELPVIDGRGRPCGMIDITDVVALFPEAGLVEGRSPGGSADADAPVVARFPAPKKTRRQTSPRGAPPRDCA
jgi:arabinose-5-phosphate isomerase